MLRVGRVGSIPDIVNAGIGKWSFEIMKHEELLSFVFAPKYGAPHIKTNANISIKSFKAFSFLPKNRFGVFRLLEWIKTIFNLIIVQLRGIIWFSSKNLDMVHLHSQMYFLILMWTKWTKKPCILSFHGEDFNYLLTNRFLQYLVTLPDLITVISPEMKDTIEKISGKNNVIYIPNGIDLHEYPDKQEPRVKTILFVASWKPVKRHMALIKAFELLIQEEEYSGYNLVIAGDGPLRRQGEEYIKKNGLSKKIFVLGKVEKDTLVDLYNSSMLSVLCSEREGFPKVVLESLSCGCPVLCTKVGALGELLGEDYQNYIENIDPIPFKKALIRSLEKPIVPTRVVNNYTWETARNTMINAYNELIDS